MNASKPKIGTYSVVCPDYRKDRFMRRVDAEAWIKSVESFGQCKHEHTIEIVVYA